MFEFLDQNYPQDSPVYARARTGVTTTFITISLFSGRFRTRTRGEGDSISLRVLHGPLCESLSVSRSLARKLSGSSRGSRFFCLFRKS